MNRGDDKLQLMRLSNLHVNVVLDHAGGHATTTTSSRYRALLRCTNHEPSPTNTVVVPNLVSPRIQQRSEGFHPAHSSPTITHNNKKYINLKRASPKEVANDSKQKEQFGVQQGIRIDHPPSSPRRFSLDSTFRARRRNSEFTWDNTVSNKMPLSSTKNSSSRMPGTESSESRQSPRSASLLALRQFADSPQGRRRRRSMGDDVPPKHTPNRRVDSPTGSYKWAPKGYRPLVPAPDLCRSVTSSSSYSSTIK